jgi:hypothetical protein
MLVEMRRAVRIWLRWSPDGSHLLLFDVGLNRLTIWEPGALPR